MTINLFVFLRVLIGLIFFVSGGEKLLGHWQSFQYVIQGYELLPANLEELVARVLPWIEFFTGLFVLLGFWLKWALRSVLVMVLTFIVAVGQALVRGINLEECGCFGELVSLSPNVVIFMDIGIFLVTLLLLDRIAAASKLSLDQYFEKSS